MSTWENKARATKGDECGAAPGSVGAAEGDTAATEGAGEGIGASSRGISSSGNIPHTPTVEDLLKAAEEGAMSGQDIAAESEVVTGGHFITTPVLRTSVVEPRGADSRTGASDPLVEGDFLERADPLDILGALRVDPSSADVLRGAGSPEARAATMLLGALLSQGGEEARMPGGESKPEEAVMPGGGPEPEDVVRSE